MRMIHISSTASKDGCCQVYSQEAVFKVTYKISIAELHLTDIKRPTSLLTEFKPVF